MPSHHPADARSGVPNAASAASPAPTRSAWAQARAWAASGRLKLRWQAVLDAGPPALPPGIDLADRVEGMMLGLAIGDALGNTTESLNPDERLARHGWIAHYLSNHHAGGRAVGLPSDDTQMAYWTLEQTLSDRRLDPARLAEIFCQRPIYGIGRTVKAFRQAMVSGRHWAECGVASAGNGALMRMAPLLLPHLRSPSRELWGDTLLAAQLTHDDLLSNASCVALVQLLWRLLGMPAAPDGPWWLDTWLAASEPLTEGRADGVFESRAGHPPGFCGSMADMVRQHVAPALAQGLGVAQACSRWHSGAFLLETVPSVLYILARHGHDQREAILQAVNNTRDNDSCAPIVGAAVGALHGAGALPADWLSALSGRTRADDDGQVFRLLARAGEAWGYGVSPGLRRRAAQVQGQGQGQGR